MGNKCHAMGETAKNIRADDHRLREEDLRRIINSYSLACGISTYAYDYVFKKNNHAKIEIEIPQDDYKPLLILTDITD